MTARHPTLWLMVGLGLFFLATSGARLYSFLYSRSDNWWTPLDKAAPLAESKERVQILVQGIELNELLETQRLRLAPPPLAAILAPLDFAVRFNNWDRVRAQRLPEMLIAAATAGSAATVLLFGLVLWSRRRREL